MTVNEKREGKIIPGILDDLEKLGIDEGDILIVHSSFKSLGLRNFGAVDVIATLLDAIGPEGTLVMPVFTYSFSKIYHPRPFNMETSPGFTGIMGNVLLNYPGALRSAQPTHSVVAVGKYAETITGNKRDASPLGTGSSFEEACNLNAKILLLGVDNASNSMVHYAEAVSCVTYNDIPCREFWGPNALIEENGKIFEIPVSEQYPGCSDNFGVVNKFLEDENLCRKGNVGKAGAILIEAKPMVDAIREKLKHTPDWLLCGSIGCEPCNLRKHRLKASGLIT